MSIYSMTDNLKQKEINLYGNSRLGICNVDIDVQNCNIASPEITKFTRGNKSYELNNHLGNVLATISDKHVQVAAPGNTVVDYYLAEVLTATDYYPFGMQMPQRQFYIDTSTYIVGTTSTTTSENNTTVVELYKHSFNDTPSVHPYVTVPTSLNSNLSGSTWTNSRNMWTNYASNTSMGKAIAFDNSTADTATVTLTLNIASNKKVGIKSFSFYNRVSNSGYRHWKMFINGIEVGDSTLYYTATGGTGNNTVKTTGTVPVKNAVEDLTGTITVLLKPYDHDAAYPNGNAQGTFRMDDFILNGYVNADGGSVGSGYQYANRGGYRYGFNGKELDKEVVQYDYGFRIYDPRLVRFKSVDPLTKSYPMLTPYQFASNSPIANVDLDGKEAEYYTTTITYTTVHRTGTSQEGGETTTTTTSSISTKHDETGWFTQGNLYTPNGALGSGTLCTVKTQIIYVYESALGLPITTEVKGESIVVGRAYKLSASDEKQMNQTIDRPQYTGSFQIMILGSGIGMYPGDQTGSKPNPNATTVVVDMNEWNEIFEPILIGMDVKGPIGMKPPEFGEILGEQFEQTVDKHKGSLSKRPVIIPASDQALEPNSTIFSICKEATHSDRIDAYITNKYGEVSDTLRKNDKTGKMDTIPTNPTKKPIKLN